MGGQGISQLQVWDLSCMGFMRKRGKFYPSLPQTQEGGILETKKVGNVLTVAVLQMQRI